MNTGHCKNYGGLVTTAGSEYKTNLLAVCLAANNEWKVFYYLRLKNT